MTHKGRADYLDLGNWNVTCDYCGKKFKATMLKKNWQGLMVCNNDFEIRQPQDFVRGVPDIQNPPWVRPEPPPVWVPGQAPDEPIAQPDDYPIVGTNG